ARRRLKPAVASRPFGGGKGGVRVAPPRLSLGGIDRLTRRYTWEIMPLLGPDKVVPAPDVNTDGRVMAWLLDTISMARGEDLPGVVTGKPLSLGGTKGHAGATSTGVVLASRGAFAELDLPFVGARAIVQVFGKVGGPLVFLLASAGMRVVAVSDVGGAVHNPGGLDPSELSDHVAATGTVAGFSGAEPIDKAAMWGLDCELVVPAALEGAIDDRVANTLGAAVVVEAANGPTTTAAGPGLDR